MMVKKAKHMALFAIAGALVAFSSTFLLSPKWEAVATLCVANVAGTPIESPPEFVDRLRSPATSSEVLRLVGPNQGIGNDEALLASTRISTIGSSIQLRVRAIAPEVAISVINAYLKVVIEQQSNLLAQQVETVKRYGLLEKVSLLNMDEGDQGSAYRAKKLETLILTYPTRFSVKPATFSNPVSPNRVLVTLLGFFIGLGLGLVRFIQSND